MSVSLRDVAAAESWQVGSDRFVPAAALRSRGEEFEAALTHGAAACLSLVGGIHLIQESVESNGSWCVLGCLFYVAALVAVFSCSTLSHLYVSERLNRRFRAWDQGCIYLLAAGSLSPFALTFLRTPGWMAFYGLSVMLAVAGFLSKVAFAHRVEKISLWFYLLLGWGQAIAMVPLLQILPSPAIVWILAGALCYTIGVVFLVLDIRRFRFHVLWHLWVMAACGCHYHAILQYVVRG